MGRQAHHEGTLPRGATVHERAEQARQPRAGKTIRAAGTDLPLRPAFRPLRIIVPVLAVLLGVPLWLQWYAGAVSLPRYCGDPEQTVARLRRILTEPRPAGDAARRPYLITAKLLFLVPRQADEEIADYLTRMRSHLRAHCR